MVRKVSNGSLSLDKLQQEGMKQSGMFYKAEMTVLDVMTNAIWRTVAEKIDLHLRNVTYGHGKIKDEVEAYVRKLWKEVHASEALPEDIKRILETLKPSSKDILRLKEYVGSNAISLDIEELPYDAQLAVLKNLDLPDLEHMRLVSKKMKELSDHNALWRYIAETIGCPLERIPYKEGEIRLKVQHFIKDLYQKAEKITRAKDAPQTIDIILSRDPTIKNIQYLQAFFKKRDQIIFERRFLGGKTSPSDYLPDSRVIRRKIPKEKLLEQKKLHFINQNLTSITSQLFECENLEILGLTANQIQSLPLEEFQKLPNLKTLILTGNPISREKVDQLQRKFPNLKIFF